MRQLGSNHHDSVWDLMSEVERAFNEAWRTPSSGNSLSRLSSNTAGEVFTPAVDVHEDQDFYLLSFDLPGMSQKDFKIDVHNGRLTVSGERTREQRSDDKSYRRFERSYGKFERSFQLPQDVNPDAIKARFENGVLEVMIPKAELAKPKSIQVESEKGGLFSRVLGQKKVESKSETAEKH